MVFLLLVFEITDIAACAFLKAKIANGSYQGINTKGNDSKEEVSTSSRLPAVGFQRGMVNNKTTNKAHEERK